MMIRITAYSPYLQKCLQDDDCLQVGDFPQNNNRLCENNRLRVHSVYRKTINLVKGDFLLALQTEGSPFSPISLMTEASGEDFAGLPVKEGDCFFNDAVHRRLVYEKKPEICFSYQGAELISTSLPACTGSVSDQDAENISALGTDDNPSSASPLLSGQGPQTRLLEMIRSVLAKDDRSLFAPLITAMAEAPGNLLKGSGGKLPEKTNGKSSPSATQNPLFTAYAQGILESVPVFLKQNDSKAAASDLCRLIGFGIGLTPSGDDFLCGFLAGMQYRHLTGTPLYRNLAPLISDGLSRTNDISRAFLCCALEGHFSLAVCRLNLYQSPAEIEEAFSAIGHSSGMDTLSGLYLGLLL